MEPQVTVLPLSGVTLCVTGVPKADRVFIRNATEILGGKYQPDLEPGCTHLIVQRCQGPKFQHAVRFGQQQALHVVTPRWLVDTILLRARQDESVHSAFPALESNHVDYQCYYPSSNSSVAPYRPPAAPLALLCNNTVAVRRETGRVGEWLVKNGVSKTLSWKCVFELLVSQRPWENRTEDSADIVTCGTSMADPVGYLHSRDVEDTAGGMLDCISISGKVCKDETSLAIVPVCTSGEGRLLEGLCFYLAPDIGEDTQQELADLVRNAGGEVAERWYVGSSVTHAVCEASSFWGCTAWGISIVTPMWLRRSIEAREFQRCVQFSADLGRHFACFAQKAFGGTTVQQAVGQNLLPSPAGSMYGGGSSAGEDNEPVSHNPMSAMDLKARGEEVRMAKIGVRRRRGPRKEPFRTRQQPPTPLVLLDNICWAVTQPPNAALLFNDADKSSPEVSRLPHVYEVPDTPDVTRPMARTNVCGGDAACQSTPAGMRIKECPQARPLTERERTEVVYRGAFITLLLPVDRFNEMGPTAKRLFVDGGVTCESLLNCMYSFYQEQMSQEEIKLAIHTDSQHADRIRTQYTFTQESLQGVACKRHEFLGSRRNFDGLRRLSRETGGQIYEVLLSS